MQEHPLAHAQQHDPVFAVILAIIESFDSKTLAQRVDRFIEGNAMVAPVGASLGIVPFERRVLHNVLIISSGFKSSGSLDSAADMMEWGGQAVNGSATT